MYQMSRLDQLIEEFNLFFPNFNAHAVDYELTGDWWLTVKMDDGSAYIYDDLENSIRRIPDDPNNMTEAQCLHEFGIRLKLLLQRRFISQGELADRIGISPVTLSGYINGKHSPGFHIVDKIAKELGCSIDEFRYL
jgi:DNA-binding Xre family transcriptional regulator